MDHNVEIPAAPQKTLNPAATGRLLHQFEAAWRAGQDPKIAEYLPPSSDPLRVRTLTDLVKVDQEYRWRQGDRKLLEAYLAEWPEARAWPETVIELLEAECFTRLLLAEPLTEEELRARFPAGAAAIDLAALREEVEEHAADGAPPDHDTPQASDVQTARPHCDKLLLEFGQRFGRYEIRKFLGQGGMGVVYRAYDTQLGREVGLKIPCFDPAEGPEVVARFLREAQAAARVDHPNICTIYDADRRDGVYYIAMKLVEGESLAERLQRGALEPRHAAELVAKIACGLAAVHAAGILHRDIKPSNVMIDGRGEPLLTDFGLARPTRHESPPQATSEPSPPTPGSELASQPLATPDAVASPAPLTATGALVGTLPYMAPEQLAGASADPRTDIYSLGVLLYQTLTGQLPFNGRPHEVLEQVRAFQPSAPRSIRPGLDPQLEKVCLTAMAKQPVDRYPSAEMLVEALQTYLQRTSPERQKRRRLLTTAGLLAVILSAVVLTLRIDCDGDHDGPGISATVSPPPAPPLWRKVEREPLVLPVTRWIETPGDDQGKAPSLEEIEPSRDGSLLYLVRGTDDGPNHIEAIEVTTGRTVRTIRLPGARHDWCLPGMAASRDGRFLFVSNYYRSLVTRIDLQKQGTRQDLMIGVPLVDWPSQVEAVPRGEKLVVVLGDDNRSVDMNNDGLSIVDISAGQFALLGKVPLNDETARHKVAVGTDGRFAYAATRPRKSKDPTLYEIQITQPFQVTASLAFPDDELRGVAVSDRWDRVFVAGKKVVVVERNSGRLQRAFDIDLEGGYLPATMAWNEPANLLIVLAPTGRKLFFLDPLDGSILARVDNLRHEPFDLALSPEGRTLFVSHRGPQGGIAVIDLQPLMPDPSVVFASNRDGESYQIYRLDLGTKKVTRLTQNHATEGYPRWSPDGRKIAFVSDRSGLPKIHVMDRDGRELAVLDRTDPLPPFGGLANQMSLDWSPDGTRLAFVSRDTRAIRIVELRTGRVRTLIEGEVGLGYADKASVCWRKSDGLILFKALQSAYGNVGGIFGVHPDTAQVQQLHEDPATAENHQAPSASPDGTWIATVCASEVPPARSSLLLLRSDGTASRRLECNPEDWHNAPRWSADGKHLVLSVGKPRLGRLCLLSVHDGACTRLATAAGDYDDMDPDLGGSVPLASP